MNNKRNKYIIIFICVLTIECLIAIFLKKGFIRENIEDILIIPCIYTMLQIIFPTRFKYLDLYVLIFAVLVEILQLLGITTLIANNNKILSIALGGMFDIKDIICYILGYFLIISCRAFKNIDREDKHYKLPQKSELAIMIIKEKMTKNQIF